MLPTVVTALYRHPREGGDTLSLNAVGLTGFSNY